MVEEVLDVVKLTGKARLLHVHGGDLPILSDRTCLRAMSGTLKQGVCAMGGGGVASREVERYDVCTRGAERQRTVTQVRLPPSCSWSIKVCAKCACRYGVGVQGGGRATGVSRALWSRNPQRVRTQVSWGRGRGVPKSGKSLEKVRNRRFSRFFQTFSGLFGGYRAQRAREIPVARRRVRKSSVIIPSSPEARDCRSPWLPPPPCVRMPNIVCLLRYGCHSLQVWQPGWPPSQALWPEGQTPS